MNFELFRETDPKVGLEQRKTNALFKLNGIQGCPI